MPFRIVSHKKADEEAARAFGIGKFLKKKMYFLYLLVKILPF
jgi:hypothetical protein